VSAASDQKQQIAYIREHYGFLAGFLDIPEIRNILLRAGSLGQQGKPISAAVLQGQVYGTTWWKKTADVTRSWDALQSTDSATANKRIAASRTQIAQMAKQAGVSVTADQLTQWSYAVNKYGWTEQQVQSAIGHQFHYNSKTAATGQAEIALSKVSDIAKQYLIPVSDATKQKWAQQIIAGEVDPAAFEGYAKAQAKSRWPGLSEAIDRGVTVEQYTDTYKQTIAQALETDPDSINLMDKKWSKVIDSVDPKTGSHVAMSLSDAETYARSQPEWLKTKQYEQGGASLAGYLSKTFGLSQ